MPRYVAMTYTAAESVVYRREFPMNVKVKLYSNLRISRFTDRIISLPNAPNIYDLMATLGIGHQEVAFCLVNGRRVELSHILADGDEVVLFPLIGGG